MKLNAPAVYAAYLAGYLGAPFAKIDPSIEETAAYALGVYWRSEPVREPEPLASVVRKVEKLLEPVEGGAGGGGKEIDWFYRTERKP